MHPNPILAVRLASLIFDERRAEAAHAARLREARVARSTNRPIEVTRRALGTALARLGTYLGGVALDRPATRPA